MEQTATSPKSRMVRSPAISPSRPLSVRHLSSDLDTYVQMYGLNQDLAAVDQYGSSVLNHSSQEGEQEFLSSSDVEQELKSLQALRRLSLDVSNLDPDVPSQNYEVQPSLQPQQQSATDQDSGNSLYWVPARIHPEIAPQEWQSFVQKRDDRVEDDSLPGLVPVVFKKKGLSRSKSLLSRVVSERTADKYTDAGPELERRRSKLRPNIKVVDLENLNEQGQIEPTETDTLSRTAIPEELSLGGDTDSPILVPPPGQILRRAARTGKAKGSYRKITKAAPPVPAIDVHHDDQHRQDTAPSPLSPQSFESETIQLRDDAPGYIASEKITITSSQHEAADDPKLVERKKSRNRTTQIVGPRSPVSTEPIALLSTPPAGTLLGDQEGDPTGAENSTRGQQNLYTMSQLTNDTEQVQQAEPLPQQTKAVDSSATVSPVHDQSRISDVQQDLAVPDQPRSQSVDIANVVNVVNMEETPLAKDVPRPGLKRELSAASLTRAVMGGTAPVASAPTINIANRKSTPEEQLPDANVGLSSSSGKKSAWGKLFSYDDKDKVKSKSTKGSTKLGRTPSQDDRQGIEKETAPSNLFTSIFGVKKKDKEQVTETARKEPIPATTRAVVRDPHFYSRYPIQLERAIYRMAHLKLGNSRRPLVHQVLLSNFMYGYLALVGANTSGQTHGPSASRRTRSTGNPGQRASAAGTSDTANTPRTTAAGYASNHKIHTSGKDLETTSLDDPNDTKSRRSGGNPETMERHGNNHHTDHARSTSEGALTPNQIHVNSPTVENSQNSRPRTHQRGGRPGLVRTESGADYVQSQD